MRRIWAKAALLVAAIALNAQTGLTPDAKRGQQIYERGTSSTGGQVEALVGGGTKVPASVLPCVNCHRHDGLGRAEGGRSAGEHQNAVKDVRKRLNDGKRLLWGQDDCPVVGLAA